MRLLVITEMNNPREVDMLKQIFLPLTGESLEEVMFSSDIPDSIPESIEVIVFVGPALFKKYYPGLKPPEWEGHLLPEREI